MNTNFSFEAINKLFDKLSYNTKLESLELIFDYNQNIDNETLTILVNSLEALTKLKTLILKFGENNQLTKQSLQKLADFLIKRSLDIKFVIFDI